MAFRPDTLDTSVLESMYGYAENQINAVPELRELYDQAVAEGWFESQLGLQRWQLAVKNSDWYRENSKYTREAFMLEQEGGAQWDTALDNARLAVQALATDLGAELSDADLELNARRYLYEGWGRDNRQQLAQTELVKFASGTLGKVGDYGQQLRSTAFLNGVKYSNGWFDSAAKSIASGLKTVNDFDREIRTQAAGRYPAFRQQIMSGMDVMDLASPYMSILSDELEIAPSMITLNDPYIQQALGGYAPDGNPTPMDLYSFSKNVRNDPRWLNTRKAVNEVSSIATGVLQMFGLRG
jgi:hypothetical protein